MFLLVKHYTLEVIDKPMVVLNLTLEVPENIKDIEYTFGINLDVRTPYSKEKEKLRHYYKNYIKLNNNMIQMLRCLTY